MNNITTYEELASEISSNESIKSKLCTFTENISKFVTEIWKDEDTIDALKNYSEKLKLENEEIIKNSEEKISEYTTEQLLKATECYLDSLNNPEFFEALKGKCVEIASHQI